MRRMLPTNHFFWTHAFNPCIKAASDFMGHRVGPCRKPVQPLSNDVRAALEATLVGLTDDGVGSVHSDDLTLACPSCKFHPAQKF